MPTLTQNDLLSVAVAKKQLTEKLKKRMGKRVLRSGKRGYPLNPNALIWLLGIRHKRRSVQRELLSMVAGAVSLVNL